MKRGLFILTLLAMLPILACKNPNQAQTPPPENQQTNVKPDNNDLLQALQGKWQSTTDSAYVLEITDAKMRHINGGKFAGESDLEVDGSCTNVSCQGAAADDGWCFLEKGQFDIQCNRVVKCDPDTLQYVAIGAANGQMSGKKIR